MEYLKKDWSTRHETNSVWCGSSDTCQMVSPECCQVCATLPKFEKNKCALNWLLCKIQCFRPMFFCFFFSLWKIGRIDPSQSDYGVYKFASKLKKFFNGVAIKLSTVHKFGQLHSLLTAVLYSALRYFLSPDSSKVMLDLPSCSFYLDAFIELILKMY